jgi:hypothetical protein
MSILYLERNQSDISPSEHFRLKRLEFIIHDEIMKMFSVLHEALPVGLKQYSRSVVLVAASSAIGRLLAEDPDQARAHQMIESFSDQLLVEHVHWLPGKKFN